MQKQGQVLSDTSIPDPLNGLAQKIRKKSSIHGDESKLTAKELLAALIPVHKPLNCFPVITSLDKCNKLNDDVKKTFKDFTDNNSDARANDALKKVCGSTERGMEEAKSETQSTSDLIEELELSHDSKWLKKCLRRPLGMAIKEILSRKPYDPIGYLGFWLLNYRRCEEISQLQLEADNELNYYRSMIEEPNWAMVELEIMLQTSKREEVSIDGGEEEEIHDWNFKHYETVPVSK